MPKTIYLLALLVTFSSLSFSQDCFNCGKRSVTLYDFTIKEIPPPSADHDSIMNFYTALKVSPAVLQYLNEFDAGRECLIPVGIPLASLLDTTRALSDPGVLELIEGIPFNEPPDMSHAPDYYITGNITPVDYNGEKFMIVELKLMSGAAEIGYGLGQLDYYPAGNPEKAVAEAVAHKMGSIFYKIRDFEVEKRNSGAPFAIDPVLTGVPAKRSIELNESTLIRFYLKDCDGEPLPGRTITLPNVWGGTLDQNTFTTDSNGEGFVMFTANGATPMVGGVIPSFTFTKPSGKPGNMKIEPVYIDITKPSDTWSVYISYSLQELRSSGSNTSSFGGDGNSHGSSIVDENLYIGSWVKPVSLPLPGYLVTETEPVAGSLKGTRHESGSFNSHWVNSAASETVIRITTSHAVTDGVFTPEFDISVGDGSYSIGVANVTAPQTGQTVEVTNSWDKIHGNQQRQDVTEADPEAYISPNVYGLIEDNTYTVSEVTNPNIYTTETVSQVINQKCSWDGSTHFSLIYDEHYMFTKNTNWPAVGVSRERLEQFRKIIIELAYNELSAESDSKVPAPYEYILSQNYPNPFNPSTTLTYSIANEGLVNLKIFNMLGEELTTIVSEIKQPGYYMVDFDASGLPSGTYFYQLRSGEYVKTNKMVVLK